MQKTYGKWPRQTPPPPLTYGKSATFFTSLKWFLGNSKTFLILPFKRPKILRKISIQALWEGGVAENIWKMTPSDPPTPLHMENSICFLQINFESFPNMQWQNRKAIDWIKWIRYCPYSESLSDNYLCINKSTKSKSKEQQNRLLHFIICKFVFGLLILKCEINE